MKLSQSTKDILSNFASINPSISVKKGNTVTTLAPDKTICAFVDVEEKFPTPFSIYDLSGFLNMLTLFSEPDLSFKDTFVEVAAGKSKCVYTYADDGIVQSIDKKVKFPPVDVEFKLPKEELNNLLKAAGTLNLNFINITKTKKSSDIIVSVVDPKNPSRNTFSVIVGEDDSNNEYSFLINREYLKVIKSNFTVSLSRQCISRWKSDEGIEYYIAVDKNSKFSE